MTKPLEGIKIIDFTHVQAGPAATQVADETPRVVNVRF